MSGTGYDITVNYSLKKPWINGDADQWGVHQNQNMDALDTLLHQNLANGPFVPLAGGVVMTGVLTLSQDPAANFDAATKHYVDNHAPLGGPYAPIASPALTGTPTAPTAVPATSTTQLATTAFVGAAVAASNPGVSSFNTRVGAITLQAADVTGVGGALLASPALTGTPSAPTAAPATSTTQLATTAFVAAAVAGSVAGVASFNTRTGPVTLQAADVTGVGGALLASPALTGTPTAPTAAPATNTTQLATTGFVAAAVGTALHDVGRNLIHNALLNVAQRGAGPFSTSGIYTLDRYYQGFTDGSLSTTRVALADSDRTQIGDEAAINSARFIVVGGSNAGSFANWSQPLENVRRLAGKTVTVSFWAKCAAATPKLGVSLDQAFGTPSGSAVVRNTGQAVTLATAWARYSVTLALPTAAGKTLGTNGDDSTILNFWFSSGSTNNTIAGGVGVQSATFFLYGIQLEVGSAATPLEQLDSQSELANCQRFYAIGNFNVSSYGLIGNVMGWNFSLPVTMRGGAVLPTLTFANTVNTNLNSNALTALNTRDVRLSGNVVASNPVSWSGTYTASQDL